MGRNKKNKKPKKQRDWQKYNHWRTRDNELMIRNLKEQVSSMRNPFRYKKKGEYRGKKRGRKPKEYKSVIMCLLLKVILKKSYRDTHSMLRADYSLRKLAGITELPSYNTMNDYMGKLPTGYIDNLIKGLYVKGLEIKKSEDVHEKEEQLMAQVLQ